MNFPKLVCIPQEPPTRSSRDRRSFFVKTGNCEEQIEQSTSERAACLLSFFHAQSQGKSERERERLREIQRERFCLRLFVSERRVKAGERERRERQGRDRKEAEMVGANLKAETMAMMESRTAVEAEMDAIIARLSRTGGAGLQGNLVDSEVHSSQLFFFFFF